MDYPSFIRAFPSLDVPFSDEIVKSFAIRSDAGLAVFFEFYQDFTLPMHSHKAQWGTVLQGEVKLTIGGETKIYGPGDSYSIPDGVEHGGDIKAGTKVIDVFEEPDRYPLQG
ncbi:cupin domain-containing protein [Aliiroseovarius sp. PrR006]|uniref:cupin domain-containing protein n=1 Tax=Aliiroseovarius sp. PrR006 TaxID=2706883 RepID=UPI0013D1B303|nr:cupin domain-containing protein [Aliiroseovarius sp. PrR006]NDW53169.1 cupin domain-containing protein [Aliiroseovarius sp. PrR006]